MALEPIKLSTGVERGSAIKGPEILYMLQTNPATALYESRQLTADMLYAGYRQGAQGSILPVAESTTIDKIGIRTQPIGTSTPNAKTCSNASLIASMRRAGFGADATAAFSAGLRVDGPYLWLGNASGLGGFECSFIFGLETLNASAQTRFFCGLAAEQDPAGLEPSALVNIVGVGCDLADTNLQLMVNDGSGLATKTDLGMAGKTVGKVWKLQLSAEPAAILISYTITDLTTLADLDGTVNLGLPASNIFMGPMLYNNNGIGGGGGVETSLMGYSGMARGY